MKATYSDFLAENPNCSKYKNNIEAIEIFNILSKDDSIIKMVDASQAGRPALSACVQDVEAYFDGLKNPTFDLTTDFPRTVVGRMVKTILAPFGFVSVRQKDMPKTVNAKLFKSASIYEYRTTPRMKIERKVVEA